MYKWQLHEAKNKLSNLVESATHGTPQFITKRGQDAAVIIGIEEYKKLTNKQNNLKKLLLSGSKFEEVEIDRVKGKARIEL